MTYWVATILFALLAMLAAQAADYMEAFPPAERVRKPLRPAPASWRGWNGPLEAATGDSGR